MDQQAGAVPGLVNPEIRLHLLLGNWAEHLRQGNQSLPNPLGMTHQARSVESHVSWAAARLLLLRLWLGAEAKV